MPYSEFTLARVKKQFELTTSEDTNIFKVVEIDLVEYYLTDVNKILGILASGVGGS